MHYSDMLLYVKQEHTAWGGIKAVLVAPELGVHPPCSVININVWHCFKLTFMTFLLAHTCILVMTLYLSDQIQCLKAGYVSKKHGMTYLVDNGSKLCPYYIYQPFLITSSQIYEDISLVARLFRV